MASRRIKLKLVQKTLSELGYKELSEQLGGSVGKKNGEGLTRRRVASHGTVDKSKIDNFVRWMVEGIEGGNYSGVISYVGLQEADSNMFIDGVGGEGGPGTGDVDLATVLKLPASSEPSVIKYITTGIVYLAKKSYFLERLILYGFQVHEAQGVEARVASTAVVSTALALGSTAGAAGAAGVAGAALPVVVGDIAREFSGAELKQSKLVEYLRDELCPLLDEMQALRDGNQHSIGRLSDKQRQVMEKLTRERESTRLLSLVMVSPLSIKDIEELLLSLRIVHDGPEILKHDFSGYVESLRASSSQTLSKLLDVDPNVGSEEREDVKIPNGYLDELILRATKYQKHISPYYLPPRTIKTGDSEEETIYPFQENMNEAFKKTFPSHHLLTLSNHTDEVWIAKFSPLGKFLVTGSLDGTLVIYDVLDNFNVLATLDPDMTGSRNRIKSNRAIVYCCWEPNEEYLVSCCLDTVVRVWSVKGVCKNVRTSVEDSTNSECKLVTSFTPGENIRTWTCEFLPPNASNISSPQFIIGSPDKVLKAYDIDGLELFDFYGDTDDSKLYFNNRDAKKDNEEKGIIDNDESNKPISDPLQSNFNRVGDLAVTPDGKFLITANDNKQVYFYSIPNLLDPNSTTTNVATINLGEKLTSCSISVGGKYLLLSITPDELQIWDISPLRKSEKPFLKRKLLGHRQGKFVVRSSFGYFSDTEEQLVMSGSLDGYIYIWKIETGQLVTRVKGHEGLLCSSVDWNRYYLPRKTGRDYGKLWCSVGDDKLVKIWGPPDWNETT